MRYREKKIKIFINLFLGPLDLSAKNYKMTQDSAVIPQFGFDSCGALDLSSSGGSSTKPSDEDTESNSESEVPQPFSKRKVVYQMSSIKSKKFIKLNRCAILLFLLSKQLGLIINELMLIDYKKRE